MMELEICVDSVESAVAAEEGGAQRVELCSSLIEGGVTPSLGLVRAARQRITIDLHVMVRPRGGDFLYSQEEVAVMRDDIAQFANAGVDGVVLGLLTRDGEVDVPGTRELVKLAQPMRTTFHRAFDMTRDLCQSLEAVIESGADRILTSGGEPTALQGSAQLRQLVQAAQKRVRVMAGGGVRVENVQDLARAGLTEFHAALRTTVPSPSQFRVAELHLGDQGVDDYTRTVVRSSDVRALREAMDGALSGKLS